MKSLTAVAGLVAVLGSEMAIAATFDGNQCLGDCSGHQAGYDWAEQNGIDDESSCNTPSASFDEGCQSYIDDNGSVSSSDDEEDEDDE